MYQRSMVCISAERHASEGHIAAYEKDTGSFCMVPYVPPCAKGEPHRWVTEVSAVTRGDIEPRGYYEVVHLTNGVHIDGQRRTTYWLVKPEYVFCAYPNCGIAASEAKG